MKFATLDINYDLWVDFCILCGCDYSKRIRGMGIIHLNILRNVEH